MSATDRDRAFGVALGHHQAGRLGDAEQAYRAILQQHPDDSDSLHLLGLVAFQTGNFEPALELIERALRIRPDGAIYHNSRGQVLERLGRFADARSSYETAVALDPEYAEGFNSLGHVLEREDRLTESQAHYETAIRLNPSYAEAHTNLGNVLKDCGALDQAISAYRRAIALRPDLPALHSNLLLTLHYHSDISPRDLAAEHRHWTERHAAPHDAATRPHANDASPERRLRIGYVSPDFREHAIARFILPVLEAHDGRNVEVFAYSDAPRPDATTGRVRAAVDVWRDVAGLDPDRLAATVRDDRIDILVDLAAHSGGNRLDVFARKPAPVQVTWLAYCSTTGLDAIDYRLSDRFLDPDDEDLSHYSEETFRLPGCYWCYSPPEGPASEWPAPERDADAPHPTFGCLNNFAKVTDRTLELWMQILSRVPDARLLLYTRAKRHRERVKDAMQRAGLDPARLDPVGRQSFDDYLRTYRRIDVALDPTPYGGGTTTCDSLWMGVPVISLAGRTAVSRAGSSLLSHAGLGHLVARTGEQYVRLATELLRDGAELANLRRELRGRLESSPVMNAPEFTRGLEATFRAMWRRWCAART